MQEYAQGKPTTSVDAIGESDDTGTMVTFWPDAEIFETLDFKYETLANRLRELSYLNSGLYLNLIDLRKLDENGNPEKETFFSEGGLREFVQFLDESRNRLIEKPTKPKEQNRVQQE